MKKYYNLGGLLIQFEERSKTLENVFIGGNLLCIINKNRKNDFVKELRKTINEFDENKLIKN